MIKKIYRLNESEVKKVLKYSKPFFSYGVVANLMKNNLSYNRFSIVIGAKTVNHNVSRNFFRRKFFDMSSKYIDDVNGKDIVFVVKKQTKLDKNNFDSIKAFEKDIAFLLKKGDV
ncbi:MAG: ribonuclease P protein component [Candidatus Altimarinota bacterium]